jgi:hypothetical protein
MLILAILILLVAPLAGLPQAPKDSWENLKQLQPGHKIKVVDKSLKSWSGKLVRVSDEAISIQEKSKQQAATVDRCNVLRVTDLQRSNRARNALIAFAVGTAVGFASARSGEDRPLIAVFIFGLPAAGVGAAVTSRPAIYRASPAAGCPSP